MGWVKVDREIWNDPIWNKKPFSPGHAWVDLMLLVNHVDSQTIFEGRPVVVARGSRITSMLKLSSRWGWTRQRVRTFLDLLKNSQKIVVQNLTNKGINVSLCNYSKWQDSQPIKQPISNQSATTVKKGRREEKSKSAKHAFKNSPFYAFDIWRGALKDWTEAKARYWWDRADGYSEANGGRYANWVRAVQNWDRERPGEAEERMPKASNLPEFMRNL